MKSKGKEAMVDFTESGLRMITNESSHIKTAIIEFENEVYPQFHKILPTVNDLLTKKYVPTPAISNNINNNNSNIRNNANNNNNNNNNNVNVSLSNGNRRRSSRLQRLDRLVNKINNNGNNNNSIENNNNNNKRQKYLSSDHKRTLVLKKRFREGLRVKIMPHLGDNHYGTSFLCPALRNTLYFFDDSCDEVDFDKKEALQKAKDKRESGINYIKDKLKVYKEYLKEIESNENANESKNGSNENDSNNVNNNNNNNINNNIANNSNNNEKTDQMPPKKKQRLSTSICGEFKDDNAIDGSESFSAIITIKPAIDEITYYLLNIVFTAEEKALFYMNPLIFWNSILARQRLPNLRSIALPQFVQMAGSIPCERVFNIATAVTAPKRAMTSDEHINDLVTLHGHYHNNVSYPWQKGKKKDENIASGTAMNTKNNICNTDNTKNDVSVVTENNNNSK